MGVLQKTERVHIQGIYLLIILFLSFFIPENIQAQHGPLLRFPDIHGNEVVFVHGEDIWISSTEGGIATRLTIHDGQERFPKFSPDGSLIAFTGEYDGNNDVYVMNKFGGNITRLTFHPGFDRVIGWHPLKNKVMFISGRKQYGFNKLYLINPDGTGLEETIFHNISNGSYSPDGKQIAFNKVGREFRTWKRYKGGTAQEIYLYNFESNEEKNLTNYEGTDRFPMWVGNKIYYSSDKDGVLNIYSLDVNTGDNQQLTFHKNFDARRPSVGGNKIIYELGGSLWVLDLENNKTSKVDITIKTDLPEVRPALVDVTDLIQGFNISPEGNNALIVARGEVFRVPAGDGATVNLTEDSGSRDKDGVWSPDAKTIAYISDKSGEYEIYIIDASGKTEAVRLSNHTNGYRHTLRWSPDSKMIGFTDHNLTLYILDVKSKNITRVDKAEFENIDVSQDIKPIYDYSWSGNSKYIAYSMMNKDLLYQIYIYDIQAKKTYQISSGIFNDFHPVFSKEGNRLFFISNRRFDPVYDDYEWEMVWKKSSGIYSIALNKKINSLFDADDENKISGSKEGVKTEIDFEGITERVEALPLPRGNYRFLATNGSSLFYLNRDEGDFNRFEFRVPATMTLFAYDFQSKSERKILEDINGYKLSFDGSKIVYKQNSSIGIIPSSAKDSPGSKLDLSGLKMWLNPRDEWKQIFNDAWRLERDYYYEPGMHQLDWNAMKEKYEPLIESASCRQDVEYVLGELIGELNTSHTYVYGGDIRRDAEAINVGLLGADYEVDELNNRYRISRILKVPDWTQAIYPPLVKPGLKVNEGDYLLAVNGNEIKADKEIYAYFQNLAGKEVTLLLNDKPNKKGAWEINVKPASSEFSLRYLDWVENNRLKVEELSGGKIGYIHLPDTYNSSAREFPKYFFGQTRKEGIIVDGRFNGGGLDPEVFLQRLNKKPVVYWTRRYSHDQISPNYAVNSHMVCLTNRQAASGGDHLPWVFRYWGMGPVIGTTSWGGLVGVSMFMQLIDGGGLTAPDYRIYTTEGKWVVENEGVAPDISIDLHPAEMAEGKDAQLLKGVEVLLKKIEEEPRIWPEHEPYPPTNLR